MSEDPIVTFSHKVVTANEIKLPTAKVGQLSPAVKQVIKEAKLTSLEDLLGSDWEPLMKTLVHEYWNAK